MAEWGSLIYYVILWKTETQNKVIKNWIVFFWTHLASCSSRRQSSSSYVRLEPLVFPFCSKLGVFSFSPFSDPFSLRLVSTFFPPLACRKSNFIWFSNNKGYYKKYQLWSYHQKCWRKRFLCRSILPNWQNFIRNQLRSRRYWHTSSISCAHLRD